MKISAHFLVPTVPHSWSGYVDGKTSQSSDLDLFVYLFTFCCVVVCVPIINLREDECSFSCHTTFERNS